MHRKKWLLAALCFAAAASAGAAADEAVARTRISQQSQGILFPKPLLSETEQADYRARVRAAKTPEELQRVHAEHYELMKIRAKQMGVDLPATPPRAGFSPHLITEDERAAQRAKIRAARREQAVEIVRPSARQALVVAGDKTPTEVTPSAATPPAAALPAVRTLPGVFSIFGPQLMTEKERAGFRARLRKARSDEERQAIRAERAQLLRQRAKEQGVTPP